MKRALVALLVLVTLTFAGLVAYGLYKRHEGRDVRGSPSVEFVTTKEKQPAKLPPKILWPVYRYDAARNGAPQGIPDRIRPPFGVRWYFRGRDLVEFPPTIAMDADTGKVRWRVRMGPSESSPLVVGKLVYVGDWRGKVYALSARTGRTVWSYQTGNKVKDGMAYAGGKVYFGSYDSHVYALNARTGKLVWKAGAQARLGSSGTFYSTPAVAYDRVYIRSTDRKVYSFGASTGKLRWSHGTGSYVYGSPAVWNQRVYVGSYDHYFYCFDAATGDVRWRLKANAPISGSAVVINGVVYFSSFKGRTYAVDARTGKLLWYFRRGKYGAVVADKQWLYLVGYARVFAMAPKARG